MMDEEVESHGSKRAKILGFKPQKEVVYNKLLPYAHQIDDESVRMLAEIKANLGKAVLMREMRPGIGMWAARLSKYMKLFGLKFSKEDHITFIHIMYELVTIPDLEPYLVGKLGNLLAALLKKRELLSPDDLVLPWRPIYELCERMFFTSQSSIGMYRYLSMSNPLRSLHSSLSDIIELGDLLTAPSSLESTMQSLAHAVRYYFPLNATQELLDLLMPYLCPFDSSSITSAIEYMEWFLPVQLPPEHSDKGYKLWLPKLMDLWESCSNAPAWENDLMWLIARLASRNVGYIDWEPYTPFMFTRFLRCLNLPVTYKDAQGAKHHKLDMGAITLWIVSTMGGKSSTQKYLDKMMKALESYYHPANFGRWFLKLRELLRKLPLHFVKRVHLERYKKPTWEPKIPEDQKLTDEDIARFVECLKPAVVQAVFSRIGAIDISQSLLHLAILRADIIIPPIVEKMYANLETLTEPHKLTCAMQCVVAVARPMVQGAKRGYKEGPTHVIPLMFATLPGIDPNDFKKCFVTFQFISTFVTMMPIMDVSNASEYWKDLTEEEETVCLATAELEDFILQFFDRCFILIENSTMEVTRLEQDSDKRSRLEIMAEGALSSTCLALLVQTSPAIFKSALRKLHSFITSHILETKVAGHFLATICRAFTKVNSEETLKVLLPHLSEAILRYVSSDEVLQEETLDKEFLYNMLLLAESLECRGHVLVPHVPLLLQILDRTLHLKCREGYEIAVNMLCNILYGLTSVAPKEYRSQPDAFTKHLKDYLPVRDWGCAGDVDNLKLEWHVPTDEEIDCAQGIVSRYLPRELETINGFINNEIPLTREELQCSLAILVGMLGCRAVLPLWEEPPVKIIDSVLPISPFKFDFKTARKFITMPDGSNVRKTLASTIHRLQEKLLREKEDDTKSFSIIIVIWEFLLLDRMSVKSNLEAHWKNFQLVKKVLEDKLVGKKRHLRSLLVNRAVLQHESLSERTTICLTETHKQIMLDLFALSISQYSEVRSKAQSKLFVALDRFPYSYTLLTSHLLEQLKLDSNENHEQFKGTLYVLLGSKSNPLVCRHDWGTVAKLWPALVTSKLSEKMSVIRLIDSIVDSVHKQFPTITIRLDFPDRCVNSARNLWSTKPYPSFSAVTDEEVQQGMQILEEKNESNKRVYLSLVNSLLDSVENGNLHWRHYTMALCFLRDLVHPDVPYTVGVIRCWMNTLIHDTLELRKIAIRAVIFILKQQKRKHKRIKVDPMTFVKSSDDNLRNELKPGPRPDNAWLQYDSKKLPRTQSEWDEPRFIHRPYYGFYTWAKEIEMYAPSSEQPTLPPNENDLSPEEQAVDSFFSNQENIDKLIKFLSLEDKKGKDKFNGFRFIMFKCLFTNWGDKHLRYFLPHLERLVKDPHESSQRCAAEILAGLMRGSKHWPFEMVSSMWEKLLPIVKMILDNMTEETVNDWGICFATACENRDPNRMHWLLETLMADPLRTEASFKVSGRLYYLQGALHQQEWRVAELLTRSLEYLDTSHLSYQFKSVRDRIGSFLANIFGPDIIIGNGSPSLSPHVAPFVDKLVPLLAVLHDGDIKQPNGYRSLHAGENAHKNSSSEIHKVNLTDEIHEVNLTDSKSEPLEERKDPSVGTDHIKTFRLFKTVCRWISATISRGQIASVPKFFDFLPLLCLLESYDADEELCRMCSSTLSLMAQSIALPQHIPYALASIKKVSQANSWYSRSSCLGFMQVFVFHNMATFYSNSLWIQEVNSIVMRLLEDDWLDVRIKAAQVLGSLIHNEFVSDTKELLEIFKAKANTKIKKKAANATMDQSTIELIRIRHAGILGLCAFIDAYPYDVPDFIPDVFLILGNHLNDPHPIPSTIRKSLSDFKRTHLDNWEQHSLKFTEEQLTILSDLTIPPSYYA